MASVELDVDYIKQETPTTCWNAGYKMMLRWTCMYESMADKLPNDKQMRERGILDGQKDDSRTCLASRVRMLRDLRVSCFDHSPFL